MNRFQVIEFIPPDLWPPNNPDLNAVYYRVWGCLQDRVYQKCIRDVDELKQHLVKVWSEFGQISVDLGTSQYLYSSRSITHPESCYSLWPTIPRRVEGGCSHRA